MNLALPAVVLFFLLLPGFVIRSRFKRTERLTVDYSPFGRVVTEGVLWAAFLHVVWLIAAHLAGHPLRTESFLALLSSDPQGQSRAVRDVASSDTLVFFYFVSMLAFSYFVPPLAREAIIRNRWDREDHPLSTLVRFHEAPWYYLLTGADYEESEVPDCIAISAIVDAAGEPMLYVGILDSFFFDDQGQLDRLILENTMRRRLVSDKPGDEAAGAVPRFYGIDGDYFVLRYSEAITLNIEYLKLQEGQTPQQALSAKN
jgi:hypothetical protein